MSLLRVTFIDDLRKVHRTSALLEKLIPMYKEGVLMKDICAETGLSKSQLERTLNWLRREHSYVFSD